MFSGRGKLSGDGKSNDKDTRIKTPDQEAHPAGSRGATGRVYFGGLFVVVSWQSLLLLLLVDT